MRRFGAENVQKRIESLGTEALESRLFSNFITSAQKQIEGKNFDIRKNLLDYDDVIAKQRTAIYEKRDSILFADNINDLIYDFFQTAGLFLAKKAISSESRDGTISGESLRKIVEPRFMAEGTFKANAYDEAPAEEAGQDLGDTLMLSYSDDLAQVAGIKIFGGLSQPALPRRGICANGPADPHRYRPEHPPPPKPSIHDSFPLCVRSCPSLAQ